MDDERLDVLVRSIRRLTVAVWVLAGVLGVILLLTVGGFILSSVTFHGPERSMGTTSMDAYPPEDEWSHFSDLPIEKQVEAANVVAVMRFAPDGKRTKCMFAEFIKRNPGVPFRYKVGDELGVCSFVPRENDYHGDGQLAFFLGNPPDYRYGVFLKGDQVGSVGGISLEELRTLVGSGEKPR